MVLFYDEIGVDRKCFYRQAVTSGEDILVLEYLKIK